MRRLVYPLMIAGGLAFCYWALARGWPSWLIGAIVVTVASVLAEILERLIPYSRHWQQSHGDFRADVWHFLVSNRAFDLGTLAALVVCAPLGKKIGVGLWPAHLPIALQALLALTILDLCWYWLHRWGHTWGWFWRLHAVHHSAERLYWWNVARSHPFDNAIVAMLSFAPLAFLGVGDAPLAVMAAFSGVHSTLMHSNVDARTGFLDLFLNTPRVHRWHHSPRVDESFANFSPTLTLWDWIFGTRRFDPSATPPEDVGLGHAFPRDFAAQMKAPFDASWWPLQK